MLGFYVREACLSSITIRGLDIDIGLSFANGIDTRWFDNALPEYALEEGTMIYCPVQYNFRPIDALILHLVTVGGQKKATMFPLQITVSRSHLDSEGKFFENWTDWCSQLSEYEVEVHFLRITEDEYHSVKRFDKKTRPSTGAAAENVVNPDYTSHRIPLSLACTDIASSLRHAREGVVLSSPPTVPPEGYVRVTTSGDSSSSGISGTKRKGGRPNKTLLSIAPRGGEVGEVSAAGGGTANGKRKAAGRLTTMREQRAKGKLAVRRSARLASIANR